MKRSKNIYELLNDMDFSMEDIEKEDLTDLEKMHLKKNLIKNRKKKFNLKTLLAIAATFVLTVSILSQTDFTKNVYAATQSKFLEITYSISQALRIERDIEPYVNIVNQVVASKGIEMKLTEVIIDEDQLYLATIVDTGEALSITDCDYKIFINGKRVLNAGGAASTRSYNDSGTIFFIDYTINVKNMALSEDLNIKIIFTGLNHYVENVSKRIKGKWEFEFTASGTELMANTTIIPLDYSFQVGDDKYMLEELRHNPVNQNIHGRFEKDSVGWLGYDIVLKGEDDLGNIVEFDLGKMLPDEVIFRLNKYNGDLSAEARTITLAPYVKEYPQNNEQGYKEKWEKIGDEFIVFLVK